MDTGVCRGCGETILWGRLWNANTHAVKAHPFNQKHEMRVVVREDGVGVIRPTYQSHYSTCPNADQFRDDRKSAAAGAGESSEPSGAA